MAKRFRHYDDRRSTQRRSYRADYMTNYKYDSTGHESSEGAVQDYISLKALKGLPKSSYSIQADPYSASLPTSMPYNILARFNRVVGGKFGGLDNLDGGNVQQYANSVKSEFLKYFDFAKVSISLNYRYVPNTFSELPKLPDGQTRGSISADYVGAGLIEQQRQAVAEAISVLQSTTFTQMAINNYAVETTIPMGSAELTMHEIDGVKHYFYENVTDVIYAALKYYQIVLLDLNNIINWHNSFRLKMGTCIRSAWNREVPSLNSLFSLFKKKSFTAVVDSLCLSLPGEYIDTDYAKQINTLSLMPSRRSNAMIDPVLELQTRMIHPRVFKLWYLDTNGDPVGGVPLFDDATNMVKKVASGSGIDSISYWDAIFDAENRLSAQSVMRWARSSDAQKLTNTDNNYFNMVKRDFDVIQMCITTFKTLFNDVREVLDVVSRTGLVTWVKGYRPSITADTDAGLFDNKIVDATYQMLFSGCNSVKMDQSSKRWKTFTLWNMYSGIPEYDAKSGGAFLTFSGKEVDTSDDKDKVYRYIPQMFIADVNNTTNDGDTTLELVARDGTTAQGEARYVVGHDNMTLCRLFPLPSQSRDIVRVPLIGDFKDMNGEAISGAANLRPYESTIIKTMTQVLGWVTFDDTMATSADHVTVSDQVIYAEPDILSIYDIEIEDITNETIAYARSTAPFKGAVGYESQLGFDTFGAK